jgi:hypothetical protein
MLGLFPLGPSCRAWAAFLALSLRCSGDALLVRFDSQTLPPQSAELTLCLLKYLNLCSEEYYLWKHKYLAKTVWTVWEGDLKRMIASPLLQREWPRLQKEYESHPDFLSYVERIQAEHKPAKVPASGY